MVMSFTGFQGSTQPDFGEQLINTVASQSIRRMFSESESVEVSIRCSPSSKLLQGSIDSIRMQGRGLVIRRQFQVEEMSFETDAIAVDFGSVLKGQIRLKQPTQAIAQVVLSEAGINRAFNGELVQHRLQQVELPSSATPAINGPVSFRDLEVKLLPANRIEIRAKGEVPHQGVVPIAVQTGLSVERRRRLVFTDPKFLSEEIPADLQGVPEALTTAFVEILNAMVDLDCFDLDGVEMRINRVETEQERLLFSGYAQINHFPGVKA